MPSIYLDENDEEKKIREAADQMLEALLKVSDHLAEYSRKDPYSEGIEDFWDEYTLKNQGLLEDVRSAISAARY
jgi:hypothetical protein